MRTSRISQSRFGYWTLFLLFLALAVALFLTSLFPKIHTEKQLIYDLIWLDAWGIFFVVLLAMWWRAPLTLRLKGFMGAVGTGIYAAVTIALFFDGSSFGYNAYWGDGKFRIAQILHFMVFGWGTDFFYKDLPTFYPPAYYYALASIGDFLSIKAHEAVRVGHLLVAFFMPICLYYLYRRIVAPVTAALIALASMLIAPVGASYFLLTPHQFIGDALFLPWWLVFVEGVGTSRRRWWHLVSGSLLGAVIFATYFYPFFIVAFLLLLKIALGPVVKWWRWTRRQWTDALAVMIGAAIISSPYWFPVLRSIVAHGIDRSRGGWHHLDSPGVDFAFLQFTLAGAVALAGILYLARRPGRPIHRAILMLFSSSLLFYLFGSITGAVGPEFNLIKLHDLVSIIAAVPAGLLAATALRWSRRQGRSRYVTYVLATAICLVLVGQLHSLARHQGIITARTAKAPTFGLSEKSATALAGKVVLTGHEELFSFYPAFTFIAQNEHYSHPAAQFASRYEFLAHLSQVRNPYLFAAALAHNRFSEVDYFFPLLEKGKYLMRISFSNYPDRHITKQITFAPDVLADTLVVRPTDSRDLYEISREQLSPLTDRRWTINPSDHAFSSLLSTHLRPYLSDEGQVLVRAHAEHVSSPVTEVQPNLPANLVDSVQVLSIDLVPTGDSTLLAVRCMILGHLDPDLRLWCHVTDTRRPFSNLDMRFPSRSSSYSAWDLVYLTRWIPSSIAGDTISLGLWDGNERVGQTLVCVLPSNGA